MVTCRTKLDTGVDQLAGCQGFCQPNILTDMAILMFMSFDMYPVKPEWSLDQWCRQHSRYGWYSSQKSKKDIYSPQLWQQHSSKKNKSPYRAGWWMNRVYRQHKSKWVHHLAVDRVPDCLYKSQILVRLAHCQVLCASCEPLVSGHRELFSNGTLCHLWRVGPRYGLSYIQVHWKRPSQCEIVWEPSDFWVLDRIGFSKFPPDKLECM